MANVNPPYETFVDEIISYKENIVDKLSLCPEIMALLSDNPDIDLESLEADEVAKKSIWDYQYVDDTVQEAGGFIMVEAAKTKDNGGIIQDFAIYVTIAVSKEFANLDHKKFIGMNGNRLDNLARFVDKELNGSREFGIGQLMPVDIRPVNSPSRFRAVMLTYEPVDMGRRARK